MLKRDKIYAPDKELHFVVKLAKIDVWCSSEKGRLNFALLIDSPFTRSIDNPTFCVDVRNNHQTVTSVVSGPFARELLGSG